MTPNRHSDNFRNFVDAMDLMLRETEKVDGRGQRKLLEDLISIELKFKRTLLSTPHGTKLYQAFMDFILKEGSDTLEESKEFFVPADRAEMMEFKEEISMEGRNILRARVYFRERQNMFSKRIAVAFHKGRSSMLHKFRINYEFARWAIDNYHGPKKRQLNRLLLEIIETRKTLCENNLPLAINRAKIFWSKIPETHLEYMDLIQASSEGLITAIDKFVPPYRTVFRTTAIGRMTLNMSTDHSATLVKLSPKDKRILYRARKARGVLKLATDSEILKYVQESFPGVTQSYLDEIMSASHNVADIDFKGPQDDKYSLSDKLPDASIPVDEQVILNDLQEKAINGIFTLYIRERKVVLLKNGDL